MLRALLFPLLAVFAMPVLAQPKPGCDFAESKQFDFWLGEWDAAYRKQDGSVGKSRNRVSKVLDGCSVLEEFTGAPGITLDGRSHSAYDRNAQRWKQTWVDNTGSYLDFVGGWADGAMILARDAERQGRKFKQRMVWRDIRADEFKWLWQRSDDGGSTWATQWEIDYRRVKK